MILFFKNVGVQEQVLVRISDDKPPGFIANSTSSRLNSQNVCDGIFFDDSHIKEIAWV